MRLFSNILGMFLVSRKLGMFGPYIAPTFYGGGSRSFDMREIAIAKRRKHRQSRGYR